jgi:putative phosphoesterase
MRYLVVSDNHGDRQILVDLAEKYKENTDYFFHCGDSELEATDELWSVFQVVKGNCDFGPGFEKNLLIDTGQDKIYLSHGHLSNVRFGLTQLSLEAEEKGANMIFFGHTHQISCEMDQNRLFLNPGSISQPRGPIRIPSYALIDSDEEEIHVQYYNRAHQPVEELEFVFSRNK